MGAPPSTDHTTCTALHPEFASRGSIQDVVDATRQFQGPIPESKPSCCWPSTRLPGSTQPSSTIAFTTAAGSAATSFQQTDTWWHSSSWTTTRSTDTPAQVSVYDPLCPEQQSSRNPSSEWRFCQRNARDSTPRKSRCSLPTQRYLQRSRCHQKRPVSRGSHGNGATSNILQEAADDF